LVVADDLLALLDVILAYMARHSPGSVQYLHAELLFQPGRRVELSQTPASADALLGFAQLSLRPAIKQVQTYRRVEVRGKPGQQVYLTFTFSQPFSLIDQADPAGGQVELEPDAVGASKTVKRAVTLPAEGLANLLLRGGDLPTVALDPDPDKADDNEGASVSGPQDFGPTHPLSTYFTQSVKALAAAFLSGDAQGQWQRFKRYAEALTPLPNQAPFVQVKTDQAGLEEQLPAFLAWAQRFFDHSAPVEPTGNGLAQTGAGPWLATAYPRVATPALVAPDAGGRLTYDHLLQDKWAHDYRYYVRPYDRYRLLWLSLYQSSNLFPGGALAVEELAEARPDPEAGGVDVVLDRTQPVDMPLVLNSARLDPPGEPGQPVPPGTTWEVIVARHAEQSLVERNQTLARQLAFRQVAFTLLRRFAYDGWVTDHDWVTDLENAVVSQGGAEAHEIDRLWVENALPDALPEAYPEQPDHVVFEPGQPLPDELARSLDLPQRIGSFQQGALVLQWEGLPFFYEHRLLLVAQTASTVSPVNEVTQRDFEYRSPDLFEADRFPAWQATVQGEEMPLLKEDGPVDGVLTHGRALALPLHRFWDCLPAEAQARWPAEAPAPEDGEGRKPASLPDPEVIYQIVEVVDGNIEVQAEIYFDKEKMQYARRQLGQRILVDETLILAPPAAPQADYVLHLALGQKNIVPIEGTMQPVDGPTGAKIKQETGKLTVYGVLTAADRDALKEALGDDRDRDKIEALYRGWFCLEPVSGPVDLAALPQEFDSLKERLDFQENGEASLIRHHGIMLQAEAQALKSLFESPEDQDAIERLYACGVSKGLYSGEIKIMARRGGAAPSEMRPIEAEPLE